MSHEKKAIMTGLKGGVDTLLKGLQRAVKQQAGSDLVGAAPVGNGIGWVEPDGSPPPKVQVEPIKR